MRMETISEWINNMCLGASYSGDNKGMAWWH